MFICSSKLVSGHLYSYQPISTVTTYLTDSDGNTTDLYDELCLVNSEINLNPDAVLDCDNFTLTEPDYLIECHELAYLDDLNYASNWTNFFDGVRMRFDNSLREEPKGTDGAALRYLFIS